MEILPFLSILCGSAESKWADHFGDMHINRTFEQKQNFKFDFNVFTSRNSYANYLIQDCTFKNMRTHPISLRNLSLNILVERSLFEKCRDPDKGGAIFATSRNKFALDKVCANECTAAVSGHFFYSEGNNSSVYLTSIIFCGKNNDNFASDTTTLSINGNYGYFKFLNCSFNKAKDTSAIKLHSTISYCINFSTINNNTHSKQTIDIFQDVVRTFSCNILNNRGEYLFAIYATELVLTETSIFGNKVTNVFFGRTGEISPAIYLFEVYIDSDISSGIRTISYQNKKVIKSSANLERMLSCGIDPVPMTAPKKVEHINNAYKK